MLKAFHFVPKEMAIAKFNDIRHHHCLGSVSIRWPLQKGLMLKPRTQKLKATSWDFPYDIIPSDLQSALEQGSGLQHNSMVCYPMIYPPRKSLPMLTRLCGRKSPLEAAVCNSFFKPTDSLILFYRRWRFLTHWPLQELCSYHQSNIIKIAFSAILSSVSGGQRWADLCEFEVSLIK